MKTLKEEHTLCLLCMECHSVKTIQTQEKEYYKGREVEFDAVYEYCERAEEYLEVEDMIRQINFRRSEKMQKDKILHFFASATIYMTLRYLGIGVSPAIAVTFILGLAKELVWDWWLGRGTPCWQDIAANCSGILFGYWVW